VTIAKCRPDFGDAPQLRALPQVKQDLPEIQWRNPGERGGGHYEKRNALPLLDENICFIIFFA
jgi:hypothetical protein